MQRTIISIALGCILPFAFTSSHLAQVSTASARQAGNARLFVVDKGVGEKVKVTLADGRRVKGRISRIRDDWFELATGPRQQPLTLDYNTVVRIKKAGWSNTAVIALGVGIGAAAVITVVAIAIATVDLDPFPDGFRKNR